jgi:hypothetical protein
VSERLGVGFHEEILRQCRSILIQGKALRDWLKGVNDPQSLDVPLCDHLHAGWSYIQGMLIAAANISKIFDPARPRGQTLLNHYGANLATLLSRKMRNHFEHFDERLQAFVEATPGMISDFNIGPKALVAAAAGEDTTFLRHYDPATGVVSFDQDEVSLREIENEARQLLLAAHQRGHTSI